MTAHSPAALERLEGLGAISAMLRSATQADHLALRAACLHGAALLSQSPMGEALLVRQGNPVKTLN